MSTRPALARSLAVLLPCLLLVACGQDVGEAAPAGPVRPAAPGAPSGADPDAPVTSPSRAGGGAVPGLVRDGEPMLTCGPGGPFPASVLRDGVPGLIDPSDVLAALEEMRQQGEGEGSLLLSEAASATDVPHRVVGTEEHGGGRDVVVLLGGLPEQGERPLLDVVLLAADDGRWRARGFGGCEVRPVLPDDLAWAEVAAPPGGLDRSASTLVVDVSELSCASGRDPEPFLRDPVVVEDEESVTLTWTSAAARGAQTCVGAPGVSRTVSLAAPLGDRVLLDGRTWPPVAVS